MNNSRSAATNPGAESVAPLTPKSFQHALEALQLRRGDLRAVRDAVTESLLVNLEWAQPISRVLNEARATGALGASDFRILSADIRKLCAEEVPTEVSVRQSPPRIIRPTSQLRKRTVAAKRPEPGSVLRGRFRLEKSVAKGNLGEVFRAIDQMKEEAGLTEARVAVKILGPQLENNAEAIRQFGREAINVQALAHPNIVNVYDIDRDGQTCFITMEWLQGESLAACLDRTRPLPMSPRALSHVLSGLGAGLAYAHARGFVHGDVKPGNVFLTEDGEVKLLDFGLARSVLDRSEPSIGGFTRAYASCEMLEGRSPELRDDVYSLACLIYRMAAGVRPFGARPALEAEAAGAKARRIADMSDNAWAVLNRALSFRRKRRDVSVEELIAAVCGPLYRPASQTRRLPWTKTLSMLLGLGLITAGGWWLLGQPKSIDSLRDYYGELRDLSLPPALSALLGQPVAGSESDDGAMATAAQPAVQPISQPVASDSEEPVTSVVNEIAEASGPVPDNIAPSSAESLVATSPVAAKVAPFDASTGWTGFGADRYRASEGDGFVRLVIQAPASHPGMRLRLAVISGSATAGEDFMPITLPVDLPAGQTRLDLLVPIVADAIPESVEDVLLRLEPADSSLTLARPETLIVIDDDD